MHSQLDALPRARSHHECQPLLPDVGPVDFPRSLYCCRSRESREDKKRTIKLGCFRNFKFYRWSALPIRIVNLKVTVELKKRVYRFSVMSMTLTYAMATSHSYQLKRKLELQLVRSITYTKYHKITIHDLATFAETNKMSITGGFFPVGNFESVARLLQQRQDSKNAKEREGRLPMSPLLITFIRDASFISRV